MINASIRDLQAILVLSESRSFARTAEKMHLSQPAMTALVHRVESQLGAKIFDRTTRQVTITPIGKVFIDGLQRMDKELGRTLSSINDLQTCTEGAVKIAVVPSFASSLLPEALKEFHAHHPNIQLTLYDVPADTCMELLRSRQVDFALTDDSQEDPDFERQRLLINSFVVAMHESHPLAKQSSIRWSEAIAYPQILLKLPSSIRKSVDQAALISNTRLIVGMEVERLNTLRALVACGLGIAILPLICTIGTRVPELDTTPLDHGLIHHNIDVIHRVGESLSPAALQMLKSLIEQIKAICPDLEP